MIERLAVGEGAGMQAVIYEYGDMLCNEGYEGFLCGQCSSGSVVEPQGLKYGLHSPFVCS